MPNILVIEDNRQFADLLVQYLGKRGITADAAPDGAAGLRAFAGGTYDLLLVDIRLPLLSGDEVCRRVRETDKGRSVPIIMMSGYVRDLSEIDAMKQEFGLRGFLMKPFSSEALYSLIAASLPGQPAAAPAPSARPASKPLPPMREDLSRTPFELVLLYLLKNRGAGVLTLATESARRTIFFVDGAPVDIDPSPEDDDFGHYLRSRNVIDAVELQEYEERKREGEDSRGLFIKMGCLTPDAFSGHYERFLRDRLVECFGWRAGSVLFEWRPAFPGAVPAASARLPALFFHGFRSHLSTGRISAFLEKRGRMYVDRTADFYEHQNHLAPEIAGAEVLDLINGSMTCSEIVNAMVSDDAAVLLFTLDYLRTLAYSETPSSAESVPPFPLRERAAAAPVEEAEVFEDLGGELSELAGDLAGLGDLVTPTGAAAAVVDGLAAREEDLRQRWEEIRDRNYYEIFGMTQKTFSFDKLKKSYFEYTRTYGPEQFFASSSEVMGLAEELLARIANAYNTLSNVVSKESYDELLASQVPTGEEERQFFEKVQYQSGKVLLEQGQFDAAEKAFLNCLTITPDKPEYLAHLAVAVYHNPANRGVPAAVKRAKDLVNRSLRGEKLALSYALKGTMLFDEGFTSLAEAEFTKALKLNPTNKVALKKMDQIRQKREEENKGFFQKIFK